MFKKAVRKIHLWLGLIPAVIVFIVGLTGTLFVFNDEIIDYINKEASYISPPSSKKLTADSVISQFQKANAGTMIAMYTTFKAFDRSVCLLAFNKKNGLTSVYINPYNGKVIKKDKTIIFFHFIAVLHATLFLGETGKTIVGICSIIFIVQCIGGMILWWPRKASKSVKNAFVLKKNASFKRRNFDFHNVLGFYASPYGIVLAFTGIIITFSPIRNTVYGIFGGSANQSVKQFMPANDTLRKDFAPIEPVVQRYFKSAPEANLISFSVPNPKMSTYRLITAQDAAIKAYNGRMVLIDKLTGEEVKMPQELSNNMAIDNINMRLHIGYYGLPLKILVFFAGIIATSLPVTGFIIWNGKRKAKRKKTNTPKIGKRERTILT